MIPMPPVREQEMKRDKNGTEARLSKPQPLHECILSPDLLDLSLAPPVSVSVKIQGGRKERNVKFNSFDLDAFLN
jgi:hypothetical protein